MIFMTRNALILCTSVCNQSVNVDAKDREGGYTAVMLAALNEHAKVMKFDLTFI